MLRIVLTSMAVSIASTGCAQKHYAYSVTASDKYVTFAVREPDATKNDYLIDCKLGKSGEYTNCYTVELPNKPGKAAR